MFSAYLRKLSQTNKYSSTILIPFIFHHENHTTINKNVSQTQETSTEKSSENLLPFVGLLKYSKENNNPLATKIAHAKIIRLGYEYSLYTTNNLVSAYVKCHQIYDASQVFDEMPAPDEISWATIILGYVQSGKFYEALGLFNDLQRCHLCPNAFCLSGIMGVCKRLKNVAYGKCVHAIILKIGFERDTYICSAIMDFYVKCDHVREALRVFEITPEQNVISWSAIVSAHAQVGNLRNALGVFSEMQLQGERPNYSSVTSLVGACKGFEALANGRGIHAFAVKSGTDAHLHVGNALVTMYGRCSEDIEDALNVFLEIHHKDVVSWTSMMSAYILHGDIKQAFVLFDDMMNQGIRPSDYSFATVLGACASIAGLKRGERFHALVVKEGFEGHICVENALTAMYAKSGSMDTARRLFDRMKTRDMISMTAMVAGYAQNGHGEQALRMFRLMQASCMKPNNYTLVGVLSACTLLTAIRQGKQVCGYVVKSGYTKHLSVGNSLVALYAKCGMIDDARRVFDEMPKRDVISWNSIINGYAQHGRGKVALELFDSMTKVENVVPDSITFMGVLSVCSHAGLVDEGCGYFKSMSRDYGLVPTIDHHACMVDLFARAGRFCAAMSYIRKMPVVPNVSVWGAVLAACRKHNNFKLGKKAAEKILTIDPEHPATHVMLASMYASAGRWEYAETVRNTMRSKGMKKEAGKSWIEVDDQIHSFVANDRSHPKCTEIYKELDTLAGQMKECGLLSNTGYVLHDVEEEQKQGIIIHHSEKLAIVFGLINTPPGTTIIVTKNLRVCGDCHDMTKFISKVTKREIIMRDSHRFHCFKDGFCSCGDYW